MAKMSGVADCRRGSRLADAALLLQLGTSSGSSIGVRDSSCFLWMRCGRCSSQLRLRMFARRPTI